MADPGSGASVTPWAMDLRGTGVSALPSVRDWVGASLGHLAPDHLADVLVVTEELTSNAYEHTAGPACVRLTALSRPCVVVVEVDDPAFAHPVVREPDAISLRGRGMVLVDRLTDAWGVHDNPDGKTIWARLSCGVPARDPCP